MQDDNKKDAGAVLQSVAPVDTAASETRAQKKTEEKKQWEYHDDSDSTADAAKINPINWTASEFIEHSKGFGWFAALAGGTVMLVAIVYLLTKDKIAAGVVVLVAVAFGRLANRKPRELSYRVDESGVQIAEKIYPYENFKSFALIQENAIDSIWFMPLKRFMPILTIYFDPNDKDKITDVLSAYLPVEDHELDVVDKLLHKIRF